MYGRDSRAPPPDRGNFEERLAADGDINRFASDFVWETSAEEYITQIDLFSNAAHQTQSFRTGFGFSAVTVQVLTSEGFLAFDERFELPGTPDPTVTVNPNVLGQTVYLSFEGHEDPTCGGFGELVVTALR